MDFARVEAEFGRLKAQFEAGALTEAEFKAQLEELMIEDERGRWWILGYETGQWYVHDGERWVPQEPPKAAPVAPPTHPQPPAAADLTPDAQPRPTAAAPSRPAAGLKSWRNRGCCFITCFFLAVPRALIFAWWLIDPVRFSFTFDSFIWPLLGIIFLPWATLIYLLVGAGGVIGFDWVYLGLGLLFDIGTYAGGVYGNRDRIPGYR